MSERDDFILDVARFIWKREITIGEFYEKLGVELDEHRVDAGDVVTEISGIFQGWKTSPDDGS